MALPDQCLSPIPCTIMVMCLGYNTFFIMMVERCGRYDVSFSPTYYIQWNPSKPDTIGTDESVLNSEVSSFQGLLSTQIRRLGQIMSVLFINSGVLGSTVVHIVIM